MTRSRAGDEFLFREFDKLFFALGIPEIVLPFHVTYSRKSPATTTPFLVLYRANSVCCTPVNKSRLFLNNLLCGFECYLWYCVIQRLEIFERLVNLYSRKVKSFKFISTKIAKLCDTEFRMRVLFIESRGNFKILLKAFKCMEMLVRG